MGDPPTVHIHTIDGTGGTPILGIYGMDMKDIGGIGGPLPVGIYTPIDQIYQLEGVPLSPLSIPVSQGSLPFPNPSC